ncbi:sirohydrochlorin chelatase [Rhizobacter sp. OV335]|jgi:sirohydrochlorin cobaltochelatase|uniref:sirohydrochlorin chelatase n=1 Tax=Rhizobacter sp. OV335 TaxID=1500264 RepID=UPI00091175E9|nr:CbiX/SirB N-terminal domain-containing protein [Rhizobacter sp. OV335]SHN31814.1 sirohydrochlorin cobaltochelatase [Rhizobacter sp. OV335]
MSRGLLLFAHGARDPNWAAPFDDVAARVRLAHPGVPVALAFLEFMAPDLRTAGRQLAMQGCTHVDVLPLFLGAGGHVRKDLPELLAELAAAHPTVRWQLHPAIGELDTVIAAMADAAGQLLAASTDTK